MLCEIKCLTSLQEWRKRFLENTKGIGFKSNKARGRVRKYKKQLERSAHILKPDKRIKMEKLFQNIIWKRRSNEWGKF